MPNTPSVRGRRLCSWTICAANSKLNGEATNVRPRRPDSTDACRKVRPVNYPSKFPLLRTGHQINRHVFASDWSHDYWLGNCKRNGSKHQSKNLIVRDHAIRFGASWIIPVFDETQIEVIFTNHTVIMRRRNMIHNKELRCVNGECVVKVLVSMVNSMKISVSVMLLKLSLVWI